MHYCIFKGADSRALGMNLEKTSPRMSPKMRIENITIPGRNGTLTTTDGTYESVTRETEFVVMDLSRISDICNLYKGTGWLTFDDEPEKRYKARVINELSPQWLTPGWRKLTVQFECQPFAYELNPQSAEFTTSGVLYNQGTFESQPVLTIYGTGNVTVTVNEKPFTVFGVADTAVVDSENLIAYSRSDLLVTRGDFPVLSTGKNTIHFAGASKLIIQPNWRWL